MRAIHRQFYRKLVSSDLHVRRELKKVDNLLPTHQEFRTRHSKLHTMVCHRMKLYPILNTHYNVEEEDGFEMVLVRAPPGAAESSAPGHIEWEKTVGSRVAAGEVVCRIRFKEDRTLDIKTPVPGVVAVRRKHEGDFVAHGDELFKVRLDASNVLKTTKKRKKSKSEEDYYDEEEEIVGDSSLKEWSAKHGISAIKSSFIRSGSRQGSDSRAQETYRGEIPSLERQKIQSSTQEPMTHGHDTIAFINKFAGVYEAKYGNKPCLRSMYVKTAAHALKLNKQLNIKLINDERVESNEVEITIAIRHLKVIVFHTVKNIDKMSYVEISRLIFEIEKQIAAGTYKTQKAERGFTISPEWEISSVVGTPSYSKTCTLGLHTIVKRPIFVENQIVAYPMMYVSLTYDKNLIEDENAVEYLKTFKESMEDPRHILVHSS